MIRAFLWHMGGIALSGVLLGGIIHIVVILTLPLLAEQTVWKHISALAAHDRMVVLDPVGPGTPNPLRLDPELVYGVCQIDLGQGPAYLSGLLPDAFWSVAVFDRAGTAIYATTNRDGIGQRLEMGIFNAAQTRLLAQRQIDVAEGLLVVEAQSDPLFVVVRLAPPHEAMRARFAARLADIRCGPRT